jgi:superfamily I DNA and/or RNA helicase
LCCRSCDAGDAATGAILTPYKGQVRSLEYGLRVLAPWFEGLSVSVSSVDAYQGREADVIVFSAVRCVTGCFSYLLQPDTSVLAPWFKGLSVSVSSVDAYQGREADVIVFSAVR